MDLSRTLHTAVRVLKQVRHDHRTSVLVLPPFLTCGLFVPREKMAQFVQYFSDIMPLTYIV
ncbi:MAG TPA: ABC transporter permease [Candidatus Saccharimonadales bacterium]|jgi:ABC-type multidrug transport system permease subunit